MSTLIHGASGASNEFYDKLDDYLDTVIMEQPRDKCRCWVNSLLWSRIFDTLNGTLKEQLWLQFDRMLRRQTQEEI